MSSEILDFLFIILSIGFVFLLCALPNKGIVKLPWAVISYTKKGLLTSLLLTLLAYLPLLNLVLRKIEPKAQKSIAQLYPID